MKLRFTDGLEIEIDGPLRVHQEFDGWYVVGRGGCTPCRDRAQAEEILADLLALARRE